MKGKVSSAELRNTANTLNTEAGNLEDLLNKVKDEMLKIGNDDVFAGDAANSLNQEFERLSGKFPEFYQAVESCAKYLNGVADNYDQFEKAIISGTGN